MDFLRLAWKLKKKKNNTFVSCDLLNRATSKNVFAKEKVFNRLQWMLYISQHILF